MANYNKRYYVVWKGRVPGVYDNLDDAMEQVDNFPGAMFKSYDSPQAAAEAYRRSEVREDKKRPWQYSSQFLKIEYSGKRQT